MQTNLLWTGKEYYSLENCLVEHSDFGAEVASVIVGTYQNIIYRVDYKIITNRRWETTFFEVRAQHQNLRQYYRLEGNGNGRWIVNGKAAENLDGCKDVDLPLTPFTNTLPINRLKLSKNEEQQIKVIYCNLLEDEMKPVTQKYIRLSDTHYQYQNVPNNFEAKIEVDDHGFVVDYPQLFVRTSAMEANYNRET